MTRSVRRKLSHSNEKNKGTVGGNLENSDEGSSCSSTVGDLDWTTLPDDTAIQLFSYLNYQDRASLSSTCRTFRLLGSSPFLWESLDLRYHKFDIAAAQSLSSRSKNVRKIRFRGEESADAIISLEARDLREIRGDFCRDITDATFSMIAARHEMLECIQLGPDVCERISSFAIRVIALCCPNLKKLQLSGIKEVTDDAINALARHCGQLVEVAFMESEAVDELALGNLASVQFLSVAGTKNLNWSTASYVWSKLSKLVCLDVSRTDITLSSVMRLFLLSQNLKVLCALNCPHFEVEVDNHMTYNHQGKILLTVFNDIFKTVGSLFADTTENERNVLSNWRKLQNNNRSLDGIVTWIESTLSHFLLRIAENNPKELDAFWIKQGASLLLDLMQSPQEDVQERAVTSIATFMVIDDDNAVVDCQKAEVVMQNGGIRLLLNLARSYRDGLKSEVAKAIANLSVDTKAAKVIAENGGIHILTSLARSLNRLVAEEAAGGLWNLSVGEEHKGAIAEAGGIKVLTDIIYKWFFGNDGILERAAGALANLATDDKCSIEVATAGGIHALVMLVRSNKFEGVQEQAARALANLAAHGDNNNNNSSIGQEVGALEALVQLTCSQHEGLRQEVVGALWNLSFDEKNRETIAAAGGITALVSLAQSCLSSSHCLQERTAGALWGLSVSEANSVAIGQEGGVASLIALACSDVPDVHETAAGALWNLAFCPSNALRIVEDGGVPTLIHLCSSSLSKMARLMAALALAYVFDGRTDEIACVGPSLERTSNTANLDGIKKMALKHIEAFVLSFFVPQTFSTALVSSAPTALRQVAEAVRIPEAGHLRCSASEIRRFVAMLRNPSSPLRACSAFALLQFTIPGGRHTLHHTSLLHNAGAPRILRSAAASLTAPIETRIFAKVVLRNLEQHHFKALK